MLSIDIYVGRDVMPGIEQLVGWINTSVLVVIAAVFLWVIITYISKLMPLLEGIKNNSEKSNLMIENNTRAFQELSKSNDNVAKALELLTHTLTQQADSMLRHEADSSKRFDLAFKMLESHTESIEELTKEVFKVRENVKTYTNLQQIKIYQGE